MKTIKIFLASSDELKDERQKFGNLIRQMDDIFIKRGIHIQLLMWEDMDPSYNNCRKQDEYNAWIRESHIFVALFHTHAGQYTLEELEVACAENSRRQEPKLMIYCRCLQSGEVEEKELQEFKQTLDKKLRHFWGNYATTDKLHLDFVLFFLRREEGRGDSVKVENGQVVLDGFMVASMDNLPFAAGNEGYQRMQKEIQELSKEIEETRVKLEKKQQKLEKKKARLEKEPDDEDNQEEYEEAKEEVEDLTSKLQSKQDKYNVMQEQFASQQQALLDTAKRVSEMQLEKVSSEQRRAIVEFEQGHIEAANAILDGIEREADRHMEQLDCNRTLVHQDIEGFQLQAKTVMADVSIPIDERIKKTAAIYAKADNWAQKSALPDEKYENLLFQYAVFLYTFAYYKEALAIYERQITMSSKIYGECHIHTAHSFNNIGNVCWKLGNSMMAIDHLSKALYIKEQILDGNHPEIAISYINIAVIYNDWGMHAVAIDYLEKARDIAVNAYGENNSTVASIYNNLGFAYYSTGKYDQALQHHFHALEIRKKILGIEHPETAISYNSIGLIYKVQKDYSKAQCYYDKALNIQEKILGFFHPDTAKSYNNIGALFCAQGDYENAIKYYEKAIASLEKSLGPTHTDTASYYRNLAYVYFDMEDWDNALQQFLQALAGLEKNVGPNNPYSADCYKRITEIYLQKRDYHKVLEYYSKTVMAYYTIGNNYEEQNKLDNALAFYEGMLSVTEKILGKEHENALSACTHIAAVYDKKNDLPKAIEYYNYALEINAKIKGDLNTSARIYNNMGTAFFGLGIFNKALENYNKAFDIWKEILGEEHQNTKIVLENIEVVKDKLRNDEHGDE